MYREGTDAFGVDHFKPKAKFPELDCEYQNLYYCCNACNSYKGSAWPDSDREAAGGGFIDPCQRDPFEHDVTADESGRLTAATEAGSYTLRWLGLNRAALIRFRIRRASLKRRIESMRAILLGPESGLDDTRRQEMKGILDDLSLEWAETFQGVRWQ